MLFRQAALFRIPADLEIARAAVEPFATGSDEFGEVQIAEGGHVREQRLQVPRRERVEVEILQRRERIS